MIEDSHQIRGDFPSQNRESDSKSLFHRVCKTLDKVKVHIVYRARLNIIYTFADATRVYVRVEGATNIGCLRRRTDATRVYVRVEGLSLFLSAGCSEDATRVYVRVEKFITKKRHAQMNVSQIFALIQNQA